MLAPSIQNVAGYKELVNYIDINAATARLTVVANTSGATIAKGSVVYVSGASVFVPSIAKAKANSITTMPGFGIVPADILDGSTGNCQFSGVMNNIDTSAFNAGDLLYVSEATAGTLTASAPTHPNVSQLVAISTKKDAVSGSVFVFSGGTTHGQEAGTLSDTFKVGAGTAGGKSLLFVNTFTGTLSWAPTAARALALPDADDTLIGKATTDTFTNKTFDSAGLGNVMKINGVTVPGKATLSSGTTTSASGSSAPAGGTGTAAGGWDTAANRDAAIAAINSHATAIAALVSAINANAASISTMEAAIIGCGIGQ